MPEVTIRKTRSYAPITAEVTIDVYEQIEKLITPPISLAQQIREQLEREGMTVKQILADNYDHGASHLRPKNMLTEREARRREVECAAVLVREREPGDGDNDMSAFYNDEGEIRTMLGESSYIGELRLQSTAQWHLLRDVIGDEGLKELMQK